VTHPLTVRDVQDVVRTGMRTVDSDTVPNARY